MNKLLLGIIALWPGKVTFLGKEKTPAEWWAQLGPSICAAIITSKDVGMAANTGDSLWDSHSINPDDLPEGTLELLPERP